MYAILGELERAKEIAGLANEVDPGNVFIFVDQAVIHLQEGNTSAAVEMFEKAVSIMDLAMLNFMLGWSYYHNGEYQKAIESLNRGVDIDEVNRDLFTAYLSNSYFKLGDIEKSDSMLAVLVQKEAEGTPFVNLPLAVVAAARGDEEGALNYLEISMDKEEGTIGYMMNLDPVFKPYHNHSRFKDLRNRMGRNVTL
jgi:tetratricopeptide (TPR) repeat protein